MSDLLPRIEAHLANHPLTNGNAPLRDVAPKIAIVGLGYVGLPTALAFHAAGCSVLGFDVNHSRLAGIRRETVDLVPDDRVLLQSALLDNEAFVLSDELPEMRHADAILICVPTPVDEHNTPDIASLSSACQSVVANAVPGQVILLTSTSYVGTTRDLLSAPLSARGFVVGEDIFVAFSPERIDPGNTKFQHRAVPRIVGGVTDECGRRAASLLGHACDEVHLVSSAEAAEMTKLFENSFRAVNIALANEAAEVARALDLDIHEVLDAAATKPYGFMRFLPGTGAGGHCIPCDPHYLLWQLRPLHVNSPVLASAMAALAARPGQIVSQIADTLSSGHQGIPGAHILVVGVAYKPDVRDVRSSPAIDIIRELLERGARADYFDPLVPSLALSDNQVLLTAARPDPRAYDLVLVNTLHQGVDYRWIRDARLILDPSGAWRRIQPLVGTVEEEPEVVWDERVEDRMIAEHTVPFEVSTPDPSGASL